MTRPQIVVNVSAALQRRGAITDTGVAFMVYAGATGSTTPVECQTAAEIAATSAPAVVQTYISTALAQGAPKVVAVRAAATDPAAVTEAEWTTALAKLSDGYGAGQVCIPGVHATAAHTALLAHAASTGRCVLLDSDPTDPAADIVTAATALAAAPGAHMATIIGGSLSFSSGAGTVTVPGSVVAAGLAARGDAVTGHANNAPAGDQGRGAGFVTGALSVVGEPTDADHDLLHAAGVSCFRTIAGQPQLYGWVSLTPDDAAYRQLNRGRMAMQLTRGIAIGAAKFLFRPIDGRGLLYAELEGMLRGYLAPLHAAGALYGTDADDAYDVDVAGVNTPATAQAGQLAAAVSVRLSAHTEKVTISVVTTAQEGTA